MIRESRYIAILQAAQYKDPNICDGLQNEEEEAYNANVKWFDELRERYWDDFEEEAKELKWCLYDEVEVEC